MDTAKSRRKRGKRLRKRACGTKIAYTQPVAIAAARALTKKSGMRFNAYRCAFCYLPSGACGWHIGHTASLGRRLG